MSPGRIRQFVLKVHSRCDLACDHCYVYEHRDQSWLRRPRVMGDETVRTAARRVAEHAETHNLRSVRVILHGGEPLLVGEAGLRSMLTELRRRIDPVTRLDLVAQSNGMRLTPALADLFVEFGVKVGISLDGDVAANDRHRRFANGSSSHGQVRAALALLRRPEYRPVYAGILCTIDVENDPVAVYEAVRAEEPPRVDFLLPHATHEDPPRHQGEYGHWLLRVYDRWRADGRPFPVRLFDALGPERAGAESVGLHPVDIAVVETDGEWEQADTLKTAFDGAPSTGLDVFRHSVDEVAAVPAIAGRQHGLVGLCATCRACPVVRQCGGGLYAHRYRDGGFDHPSVYCDDLKELITGINERTEPTTVDGTADRVLPALVAELGSGGGGADAVAFLAGTQVDFTRALVVQVGRTAAASDPALEGWRLLADLDERALVERDDTAAAAVRAVLAHPYLRPWALAVLDGRIPADGMAAIAAAAAIRAGAEVELPVPVIDGACFLPTLGTARLADAASGTGRLSVTPDGFRLRLGDASAGLRDGQPVAGRWWPARRLELPDLTVLLEDQDPHRASHEWRPAGPLAAAEVAGWQERATVAWQRVMIDGVRYVPGLTAGLLAITPLTPNPGRPLRSSTARDAFGAVAATPADPDALSVMLVHEFQHSKLGALLDLCDLLHLGYGRYVRVGWRPDPRPLEGVLQGTYAHLAVCDLWRTRSRRDGDSAAERRFRDYRDQTASALDALRDSGALTALGALFVDRMAQTLNGLV